MRSLALAVLLIPAAFAQAPPPAGNAYAGSQLCGTCHTDLAQQFYKNPHYKSIASGKEAPDKTGCEGCHGPGKDHVAAGGGAANIRAFSRMSPSQVVGACLTCHAKDFSKANIQRSAHTEADVVCTNCHSIHGSTQPKFLLAKKQNELCYGCHTDVRAQFNMPVKHRVNEGAIQCTDCHNPHGNFAPSWRTGTGAALVTASHDNEEPCLKCHVDKRGPFTFEHASVRVEGCMGCHVPHGSTNAKLLKRPVVFTVCLECHNGAGTYGRENLGVFTQSSSHNMLDPKFQQCTQCHVRIHGSNADPRFLR
ncbi:MAG TPA: DmsE family decaheme c-type cytochrome [Bryobacteraceae bacterium]|jgi:DmsE family decaheme c-type cytochrome